MVRIFLVRSKFEEEPINKRILKLLENYKYSLFDERANEITTLQAILKETRAEEDILYLHAHSVPMITKDQFDQILKEIPKEDTDVFSLCRWMDRCTQNTDCRELISGIDSVRTRGAFNIHVAWISAKAREFFLKISFPGEILKAQQEGKLYTRVTFINCFEYDLSKAKTDVDRLRRFPCQFAEPTPRSEIVSYITVQEERKNAQLEAVKEREEAVKKEQTKKSWNNEYDAYRMSGGLFTSTTLIKLLFWVLVIFLIIKLLRR